MTAAPPVMPPNIRTCRRRSGPGLSPICTGVGRHPAGLQQHQQEPARLLSDRSHLAPGCVPVPANKYTPGWADTANAVNPATSSFNGAVQPLVIADFGSGTFSMNYRNEPLPLRLNNPVDPARRRRRRGPAASITGRNAAFAKQPDAGGKINPACTDSSCFIYPQNCRSAPE